MSVLFTSEDCVRDMYTGAECNDGKILVINPQYLAPGFQSPDYQLFRAESGFGCTPSGRGNAIFGTFVKDGQRCRMEKYAFFGVANDVLIERAEELEAAFRKNKRRK